MERRELASVDWDSWTPMTILWMDAKSQFQRKSVRLENAENGVMSVLASSAATGRVSIAPTTHSAVNANGASTRKDTVIRNRTTRPKSQAAIARSNATFLAKNATSNARIAAIPTAALTDALIQTDHSVTMEHVLAILTNILKSTSSQLLAISSRILSSDVQKVQAHLMAK